MKRSSYSYVSKSASSSAGNGLSAKRPLAVRGIMPTHQSDNSLNSHNTGGSGNAVGAGTFGAAEDTTRASLNDERPSAGSAAGLDASLQVEPELAVEAPAQVSTSVPASLLASIEVITPMARGPGGASRGAVSSTRLSSSTPAAEATTIITVATGGDEGNVDTEEFVTSSSIEPISVPETPQSSTEDVGEPSALQSEDAFQVTGEADAEATTPLEPSSSNALRRAATTYSALASAPEAISPLMSTTAVCGVLLLVLGDAYHYLNQRYKSELYAAYNGSLKQRYPFSAHSESDVAIADFREFFKAQGIAERFFDGYLKPFVSGSAGQYQLRRVDGRGLPLSREFLLQMSHVQTIRRSFFAENPNEPKVLFKLEPYSLDSSLGRANFRFGSEQMEYRHGPIVQTAFSWPAEANEGRTSLVVEELGGRKVGIEKNTGPWSLFRLLDLMSVDYHSGRDVLMLKADLGGLRANYLLHSQRSPNPFDLDQLRSFKLPATL